ncbi:MAG: Anthranilate phosphoribosyltransferase [Arenicellales bacterium IbO2]|nr:anthranilate phosphoribosyltransferase [Gammaproteobacteria bacterium]MDA8023948.1 anthranilate phosphoribosyltransferase [Gammaproteobacteria bacterium]CAJ2376788.1 MAG: Anthranilate phosphoribosyltransferase [Arenicellales bacterium IbO2]
MNLADATLKLADNKDLTREEMVDVMRIIMNGEADSADIVLFLGALASKGEAVAEIIGAAVIMREFCAKVKTDKKDLADSVGTGGDGAKLFNISTAAAFTAAAAGAVIAKHGNRAASGNCGSADVLEAAGVDITLTPEQVGKCIDECGIGFMFAPTHHAATRHVMEARREIGVRTVFNLLGPLTNPAGARRQLVGVFDAKWLVPLAEVFRELGSEHTLVVCSDDGLDEISVAAGTNVAELQNGEIREYRIEPEELGVKKVPLGGLAVADATESLGLLRAVLGGEPADPDGAAEGMVALNAGATLYAADVCDSLPDGVARAREVLKSGAALAKLEELAAFSRELKGN